MEKDRRNFLKKASAAGIGLSLSPSIAFSKDKKKKNKALIGLIGVGARGRSHLKLLLNRSDVEIISVCDIDPEAIEKSKKMIREAGKKMPEFYTAHEHSYQEMLKKEKLEGVIISTPWRWHVPMSVDAMKCGVYAGVEVSAAMNMKECWDLVDTYEATKVPCMILENVCYRRDVMAVLNMVRQNLFGELVHFRGGYCHDLRSVKFNNGKQYYGGGVEFGEKAYSEAKWRTKYSLMREADIYPTHGLGPLAMYANINRGNRFKSLVSIASKGVGLHDYILNHPKGGINHPNASKEFKLGDVITSIITCENGETILLTHDTNLVRPYSLDFRVQGTRGIWEVDADKIHLAGKTKDHHWDKASETWLKEYDHPLWKKYEKDATGAGHGGMDFFVIHAFVEAVKNKTEPPLDVYDAAAWSAITPLSEASIQLGGEPQTFPDFTRGKWMHRSPIYQQPTDNILL